MIYLKYLRSLLFHKWYVFLAGNLLNVPLWRLIIHDWSKFTPIEFFGYAGNIGGVSSKEKWAIAWLHHLHHNPHHPEHWVLSWRGDPNYYDDLGEVVADFVTVLPMPKTYVHEMIADMLATGKMVTGHWDMATWLNANGPSMNLHSNTIKHIGDIMIELGYFLTDNCEWSYMAGEEFKEWAND